jgi:hypothetical protein
MSEFSDNVKHRLMAVGLLNLEDKPELLNILKCYFEGIWNISDIVVYEKTIFTTIYTYVDNFDLERIFNKFDSEFPDYVRSISLFLLNQNSNNSYRYISVFNSGLSACVDKDKLDQCFLDYNGRRRVGFNKNGYT